MKNSYSTLDDQDLLLQLKAGKKEAFDEIYNRYAQFLFQYAHKCLPNWDDADDLVQDLFFKLWTKKETVHVLGSLKAYLTLCLKNLIIDKHRHQKIEANYLKFLDPHDLQDNGTENYMNQKDYKTVLHQHITELPPRMQEILVLRKVEDLSISEIAAFLNITKQTVKNQILTAMNRLKSSLNYHSLFSLLIFFFF
nr:sigma-70 family RNA polymerase sigma factor [Pseudopedobacter sp.]